MSDKRYVIWEQQSDGSKVGIDFGVPGPFGDFALGFRFADGGTRVAAVYRIAESSLFVTLLEHWARSVDPSQVLSDLELVRAAITETTAGLAKTARSENDFRTEMHRISSPMPTRSPSRRTSSDEGGDQLTVSPTDTGLDLIAENAAELVRPRRQCLRAETRCRNDLAQLLRRGFSHSPDSPEHVGLLRGPRRFRDGDPRTNVSDEPAVTISDGQPASPQAQTRA